MNPRVKSAIAIDSHTLRLTFTNGEEKLFDCKPYLDIGIFKLLQDKEYFKNIKVSNGTVEWADGQDFCPDTLYIESYPNNTWVQASGVHPTNAIIDTIK